MAHPKYARFHLCDLQLQTPADRAHWTGRRSRLSETEDDALMASAAAFVARCYEVGLDVIGVTDHNMGGEVGLRYLQCIVDQAQEQAAVHHRRITVFPGFEVVARLPGNIHLLALFEPGRPISEVSGVLSTLGLAEHSRTRGAKSTSGLEEIVRKVQDDEHGLIIAAHADRSDGALDDRRTAEVWQQDIIRNESLLCIELPKPRSAYEEASGKLGMIVRNDAGDWRRSHPLAVVNSSDCKRLDETDGTGDDGWIGKRSTWIKMSRPSIEGLRQAFLDHESRITFGTRPEDQQTYPRIERIRIEGAHFLADQEIQLSPNLNAFIGGGGTGKSSVLEFVRAASGQPPGTGEDVKANHNKIVQSLRGGSVSLDVTVGESTTTYTHRRDAPTTAGRASFPIVALSQREVFAIATSPAATLGLLDQLQQDRMEALGRQSVRASQALVELDTDLARIPDLKSQKERVQSELERLDSVIEALDVLGQDVGDGSLT